MWFKVVFNKDGSVSSCEESGPSVSEGRHVFYVEANSKDAAIKVAKKGFADRIHGNRQRRFASGLCKDCGLAPHRAGRKTCAGCATRACQLSKASAQRRVERGGRLLTQDEAALARRDALLKIQRMSADKRRKPILDIGDPKLVSVARRATEDARDAFRRLSVSAFEAWLDERIVALGGDACPKAAE